MGQEKKISDSELRDIDVHALKEDYVGRKNISKYDLYYDGKQIIIETKSGEIVEETGMSKDDAREYYPKEDHARRY